jgi:hypothetical protein
MKMAATALVTRDVKDLESLFPKRLQQKLPFWSSARHDCKCSWCSDELDRGEAVVVDSEKHLVLCLQCGAGHIQDSRAVTELSPLVKWRRTDRPQRLPVVPPKVVKAPVISGYEPLPHLSASEREEFWEERRGS